MFFFFKYFRTDSYKVVSIKRMLEEKSDILDIFEQDYYEESIVFRDLMDYLKEQNNYYC